MKYISEEALRHALSSLATIGGKSLVKEFLISKLMGVNAKDSIPIAAQSKTENETYLSGATMPRTNTGLAAFHTFLWSGNKTPQTMPGCYGFNPFNQEFMTFEWPRSSFYKIVTGTLKDTIYTLNKETTPQQFMLGANYLESLPTVLPKGRLVSAGSAALFAFRFDELEDDIDMAFLIKMFRSRFNLNSEEWSIIFDDSPIGIDDIFADKPILPDLYFSIVSEICKKPFHQETNTTTQLLNYNSSDIANEVFAELLESKVVLIKGPPASGKTFILSEMQELFRSSQNPALGSTRHVRKLAFHSGTRHSDFIAGVTTQPNSDGIKFRWNAGPLLELSLLSHSSGDASLLIIDEINRGDALAIFGDAMVAIEPDKRAGLMAEFPVSYVDENGHLAHFYVPPNLYIIAAMNEADVSVSKLDVAFHRRFSPIDIKPNTAIASSLIQTCAQEYNDKFDFTGIIQAWFCINERIEFIKGSAYQIGHGVFVPSDSGSLTHLIERAWRRIDAHVREIFTHDSHAMIHILSAEQQHSPYSVIEKTIGTRTYTKVIAPSTWDLSKIRAAVDAILMSND